jgi:ABC-type lipoprotein release transport system permease subunit
VLWLILRQGLVPISSGLALGLAGALAVGRVLQVLLYNVTASDPVTFVSISVLLTVITTIACLVPARRAMRLDPVVALRME